MTPYEHGEDVYGLTNNPELLQENGTINLGELHERISPWTTGETGSRTDMFTNILQTHEVGMEPGEFIWTGGDCHIYSNHLEQVKKQLGYGNDPEGKPYPPREPYPYPKLAIRTQKPSIFEYEYEDFELIGYKHHPKITAPVAV